jgi:hypothetical protein
MGSQSFMGSQGVPLGPAPAADGGRGGEAPTGTNGESCIWIDVRHWHPEGGRRPGLFFPCS